MPNKKSPLYNYKSPRDYPVFNMGNEASPAFRMKYSNSAFPFKSPVKDHERHSEGWVIEHPNQSSVEVEKLKQEGMTTKEKSDAYDKRMIKKLQEKIKRKKKKETVK